MMDRIVVIVAGQVDDFVGAFLGARHRFWGGEIKSVPLFSLANCLYNVVEPHSLGQKRFDTKCLSRLVRRKDKLWHRLVDLG